MHAFIINANDELNIFLLLYIGMNKIIFWCLLVSGVYGKSNLFIRNLLGLVYVKVRSTTYACIYYRNLKANECSYVYIEVKANIL